MSSFDFENEVLDTSWIDEEDRIMNTDFNTLNKEKMGKINIYFFYIDKDNCVDRIENTVFNFDVDDTSSAAAATGSPQSVMNTNKILKLIQDNKTIIKDTVKKHYTLVDILSFQVNLENQNLQNYNDTFPTFDDNIDLKEYVKKEISAEDSDDDDDDDESDSDYDDDKIKITDNDIKLNDDNSDNESDDTIIRKKKEAEYYKKNYLNNSADLTDDENYAENFNVGDGGGGGVGGGGSGITPSSFLYFKHDLTKYDSAYSAFFKKHSYFDNIVIDPSLFIFHSLTSLFFMFKEKTRTRQKLPPLRSILKKYNKTHKNSADSVENNKPQNNKTKKNVLIVLPEEDTMQKNLNGGATNNTTKKKYNSGGDDDGDDDDDDDDAGTDDEDANLFM